MRIGIVCMPVYETGRRRRACCSKNDDNDHIIVMSKMMTILTIVNYTINNTDCITYSDRPIFVTVCIVFLKLLLSLARNVFN